MRVAVAVVLCMLAAAPSARADTIVFRRGGDIWRMAPDGTGQRQLTSGILSLEWPSAADDGTIVAADDTGSLRRLTREGKPLGEPIPTAATLATENDDAEPPTHVRVSPDGTRIAYDEVIDGEATTLWTTTTANGLELPGQDVGQVGLVAPSWIGSSRLLLSRDVGADDEGAAFSLYDVGEGDESADPWFNDDGASWASGHDATASRTGTRIAATENDAADNDAVPKRVALRLFTATAPGATPVFRCEIGLEAADTYDLASPTFSPDGTRIAWAESDGIHVASLGALDDCAAIREQVVTLPGAWEPYWTPATDPAPGGSSTPTTSTLTLAVKTRRHPHRLTLRKRGLRARITVSAPTTVQLTLRGHGVNRTVTRKLASAGTTTIRVRLRQGVATSVKRLTLRVTAERAPAVTATIRPRL